MVLPAASRSIAMMRRFFAHALQICEANTDREEAALVLSELVTNALEHGHAAALSVAIRIDEARTTVAVSDESERPPEMQPVGGRPHHGQGLHIVDRVAEEWGWSYNADGEKVVWAVLGAGSPLTSARSSR